MATLDDSVHARVVVKASSGMEKIILECSSEGCLFVGALTSIFRLFQEVRRVWRHF